MPGPFRFGVTAAHAPSRTVWITIARRVEELGYATLLIPDRMNVGSLSPTPALAVAASATTSMYSVMDIVILCFSPGKPPRSICFPMAALNLAWEQASHRPSFNRWAFRLGARAHASII